MPRRRVGRRHAATAAHAPSAWFLWLWPPGTEAAM